VGLEPIVSGIERLGEKEGAEIRVDFVHKASHTSGQGEKPRGAGGSGRGRTRARSGVWCWRWGSRGETHLEQDILMFLPRVRPPIFHFGTLAQLGGNPIECIPHLDRAEDLWNVSATFLWVKITPEQERFPGFQ